MKTQRSIYPEIVTVSSFDMRRETRGQNQVSDPINIERMRLFSEIEVR